MTSEKPFIPRDSHKLFFTVACVLCGAGLVLTLLAVVVGGEALRWPMIAVLLALPAAAGAPLLRNDAVRRTVTALAWLTVIAAVLAL